MNIVLGWDRMLADEVRNAGSAVRPEKISILMMVDTSCFVISEKCVRSLRGMPSILLNLLGQANLLNIM